MFILHFYHKLRGGAGFALFIRDKLRLSQAHPLGQGVAELRTEAEALRLGLQAVLDLPHRSSILISVQRNHRIKAL